MEEKSFFNSMEDVMIELLKIIGKREQEINEKIREAQARIDSIKRERNNGK